jgi:hypothetical protein
MLEENKALVRGSWEMEGPEDLDEFYPPGCSVAHA